MNLEDSFDGESLGFDFDVFMIWVAHDGKRSWKAYAFVTRWHGEEV